MNIADITTASKDIIAMLGEYHNAPRREMHLDPMLYALLKGRFTHIARQHHVRIYGSPRPKRIDFRYGGSNPVVIEFAVRPPNGGGQLYGTQNVSELQKIMQSLFDASQT